jgi:hypothetical protein
MFAIIPIGQSYFLAIGESITIPITIALLSKYKWAKNLGFLGLFALLFSDSAQAVLNQITASGPGNEIMGGWEIFWSSNIGFDVSYSTCLYVVSLLLLFTVYLETRYGRSLFRANVTKIILIAGLASLISIFELYIPNPSLNLNSLWRALISGLLVASETSVIVMTRLCGRFAASRIRSRLRAQGVSEFSTLLGHH